MRKQILYITYDGLTDPLGQSQVLPYIIGLSKNGYRFTIISFEKKDKFERLKSEIDMQCRTHSIKWIPLAYHKNPPVLSTIYDVWKLWKSVKREYKNNPFQIVHCRSYITSLIGLKTKQKWGVKFIFDMRGFWADERVEGGLWDLKNPVYKFIYTFFKAKERRFLNEADHIITLTKKSLNQLSYLVPKKHFPVTVIPTCVDDFFISPQIDSSKIRRELNIKLNDFVLLYIGSLGTWYMIEEMMHAFSILRRLVPDSTFVIISQDNPSDINGFYEKFNIPKEKIIIRPARRDKISEYISICNWSIFFIKPVYSKIASSPTKLGEILISRKPVLCNGSVGDIDELFNNYNLGYCIQAFDNATLERAVTYMVNNSRMQADDHVVDEWFSLGKAISKIETIYRSLLNDN